MEGTCQDILVEQTNRSSTCFKEKFALSALFALVPTFQFVPSTLI